MIEDTKLTLDILKYLEQNGLPSPSVEHIIKQFGSRSYNDVAYSLVCAIDAELIEGRYRLAGEFGNPDQYVIVNIGRLTAPGKSYVQNSNRVGELLKQNEQSITTVDIAKAMEKMRVQKIEDNFKKWE